MPENRALPDLVSRLRIDTTDLEGAAVRTRASTAKIEGGLNSMNVATHKSHEQFKAATGVLGEHGEAAEKLHGKLGSLSALMSGGLMGSIGLVAGAAGVGLLVEGMHSAVEISEKWESANKSLAQSADVSQVSMDGLVAARDKFIAQNRAFVKDQSEVTEGFATFTREGLDATKVQRDMNIALDLSKLKHVSLTDAVHMVAGAEQGRMKPLIDLGINTKAMNLANHDATKEMELLAAAQKDVNRTEENLIKVKQNHKSTVQQVEDAEKKHTEAVKHYNEVAAEQRAKIDVIQQAMDELKDKTDKGRDSTSEMDQKMTELNNDWQDLAHRAGPSLVGAMTAVIDRADKIYQAFDALGKNDAWWANLNHGLITVLRTAQQLYNVTTAISTLGLVQPGRTDTAYTPPGELPDGGRLLQGRARGGSVVPGRVYRVGEEGPETLVMGSHGGMVIPNSGANGANTHYNLTLHGASAVNDPDGVRRMLQRMAAMGVAT